jgi:dihydropteroate synthase
MHGAAVVRVHDVAISARVVRLLDILERVTPDGLAA